LNFITKLGNKDIENYNLIEPQDVSIEKKTGMLLVLEKKGGKFYRIAPGLRIIWSSNTIFSPFDIAKLKTKLVYKITSESLVSAVVLDIANNLVRKLENNAWKQIGSYEVSWDGKNDMGVCVPEGDYTIQIIANVAVDIPQKSDFDPERFDQTIYDKYFKGGFAQEIKQAVRVQHPVIVKMEMVNPKCITTAKPQSTLQYSIPK